MVTPDTLGGGTLNSWYQASTITGVSDGAAISTWADSSSLAHNLTTIQGTAPVWRATDAPGGKPCVDNIAAVGSLYGAADNDLPVGDVTFFAMFKVTSAVTAQRDILGGASTADAEFYLTSSNRVGLNRSGLTVVAVSTLTFTTGVWTPVVITYIKSTGAATVRLGASSEAVAGSVNAVFNGNTKPQALAYRSGGANDFRGQMAEVGCYSSALSSTDADALLAYLTAVPVGVRRATMVGGGGSAAQRASRW